MLSRCLLQEARASLPHATMSQLKQVLALTNAIGGPGPLELSTGPLPFEPHMFLSAHDFSKLTSMKLFHVQMVPWKHLDILVLYTVHFFTLVSYLNTKWQELLPPTDDKDLQQAGIYSDLVPQPNRGINCWLLHRALSIGVFVVFTVPWHCPFYSEREIIHSVHQVAAFLPDHPEAYVEVLAVLFLTFVS